MAELELSKVVNMIMENPELVEKIRSLGMEKDVHEVEKAEIPQEKTAPVISLHNEKSSKRRELLSALKSFLSEDRQKSLESIMNVADVFDAVRRKE